VPPHAAAAVPVSKSSEENVPPKGRFMCTCGSMPPGTTSFPVASTVRSAVTPMAPATPGAYSAAIVSPSTRRSPAIAPVGFTIVPPVMSVRAICVLPTGR
jgi:hypothetical protein